MTEDEYTQCVWLSHQLKSHNNLQESTPGGKAVTCQPSVHTESGKSRGLDFSKEAHFPPAPISL